MRTGSKQKLKYVIILEILRQEIDADHPMQTNTLLKKLEEQGIECSRETLYSDVKALNENGFEIFCNRSSSNEYYIEDRSFDVPEIRILIDAVSSFRSIELFLRKYKIVLIHIITILLSGVKLFFVNGQKISLYFL